MMLGTFRGSFVLGREETGSTKRWSVKRLIRPRRNTLKAIRRRTYEIIEVGRGDDDASRTFDACIIILIVLNIAAFVAETMPELAAAYGPWFRLSRPFRLWSSRSNMRSAFGRRLKCRSLRACDHGERGFIYATRGYLIIDLLAILPFYLAGLIGIDLGCCACCGCCAS